ncbi:hypothetical protein [Flavobacterium sp.]|jgi:hypothetical protein|uniref:hypothetical protein n=1 Tax=Flavobacterium sp. TaxID=239 RepID=UPI0037BEA07B
MLKDNVKANGTLVVELRDENGNVKQQFEKNLVVNTGLAYIASRMKDATANVMSHMAVGSGTVAAAAADTALGSELGRVALTSTSIVTTTADNDSVQYVATFEPGTGTGAVTEAAILNASSAGTMLSRTVFPVINKGVLDTLTITWKVTVA